MVAGDTNSNQASKQCRVRELMATDVTPFLEDGWEAFQFSFAPTHDMIWRLTPPLLSKEDGLLRAQDYLNNHKERAFNRVCYSYQDNLIDPGDPMLPRGLCCPNCTSHQTALAFVRTSKLLRVPIWNCLERLVNVRYPVNPCVACLICQVHDPLMDRLWHRCAKMVELREPAFFLAPNDRDRAAQLCVHCHEGPTNVTCMCR